MNTTLISILSGLGGMFGWGLSDFFANQTSDKIGHTKAFFWSQVAGLALISIFLVFSWRSAAISPTLLLLTIIGGMAYGIGYLFFYRGFEIGNVSVVSAVINVQVLFVMMIAFFVFGQRLTLWQLPAIAAVLLGIILVSVNFNHLKSGAISLMVGVKETILAALIFGFVYWPVNEYVVERADWMVVIFLTKLTALLVVYFLSRKNNHSLEFRGTPQKIKTMVMVMGVLEALAVVSVTVGLSLGDSIIVAPVSSALSVVTISLAIIFLKEKISVIQGLGIALTIGGIIATALV